MLTMTRTSKRRRLNSHNSQHYVYMATQSKQDATDSNSGFEHNRKAQKDRAQWTLEDETALVTCLLKHKSEGGDGANFKPSVWSQVAEEMKQHKTKGGDKTSDSCKSKWSRVCTQCRVFASDQ